VRVAFDPEPAPVQKTLIKYEWREVLCKKGILRCGQETGNRLWDDDAYAPFPPGYGTELIGRTLCHRAHYLREDSLRAENRMPERISHELLAVKIRVDPRLKLLCFFCDLGALLAKIKAPESGVWMLVFPPPA
jgi:hypothetical protein